MPGSPLAVRLARPTIAVLLVLPVPAGSRAHPSGQGRGQKFDPLDVLDLAAMTLTPADLEDAGLERFGCVSGRVLWLEEIVAGFAEARDKPPAEIRQVLEGAGLR